MQTQTLEVMERHVPGLNVWERLQRPGSGSGRVNREALCTFTTNLATLLNAGIPLMRCLQTLYQQEKNRNFKKIILQIRNDIEAGENLSSALSKHPSVFKSIFVSLIRAGEAAGLVEQTLQRISAQFEKSIRLQKQVRTALAYPVIVLSLAVVIVGFLLVAIVPTFEGVYEKLHIQLPFITLALMFMSRSLIKAWWAIPAFSFSAWVVLKVAMRAEKNRLLWDRAKLSLPVFGELNRQIACSKFVHSFGALIASGVTVVESLHLCEELVENREVAFMLKDLRENVSRGETIAERLDSYNIFPPMVVQMITVGEQSGKIDDSLLKITEFLERSIESTIKKLVTLIEPVLTVGLGVVVGLIALAIYLPMFDLIKHISH